MGGRRGGDYSGLGPRDLWRDKIGVWAAASADWALIVAKIPLDHDKSALYCYNARIRSSDRPRPLARLPFRAGLIADLRDNALVYAPSTITRTFRSD